MVCASAACRPAAINHAEEALRLIGDTDPAEQGAASFALGDALTKKGDIGRGSATLRRAIDLLAGQRLWREAAAAALRLRLETEFKPHFQNPTPNTGLDLRP